MISKDNKSSHKKHAKIARPALGHFGRNEIAILGTPCGKIKNLVFQVTQALAKKYKIAYIDADHKNADHEEEEGRNDHTALAYGAKLEFTDKITFSRFDYDGAFNTFQVKNLFYGQDLILVNGNHFLAKQQIIVIDPQKSLEKKLEKLTDVRLILMAEGAEEVPSYVQEHLGNSAIPVMRLSETDKIAVFLDNWMQENIAPLYGLVLAGGKSQRMNQDKSLINYHGKPQREHVHQMLSNVCDQVYMSCRAEQEEEFKNRYSFISDKFVGLGPFGALLSAFQQNPDAAWLVLACDLPYFSETSLKYLVNNRNSSSIATSFKGTQNDFPEPLIAIWEPRSYPALLQFMALGYSCPRKVLINSDTHLLTAPDIKELGNVNHPEEYEEAIKVLEGRN